ncbi:hypothetical protein QQP08_012149 [Theobroma cacao]|nr:hypothetical protein QQP08_012149 [Theobroma cacao]
MGHCRNFINSHPHFRVSHGLSQDDKLDICPLIFWKYRNYLVPCPCAFLAGKAGRLLLLKPIKH